MAYRDDLEALEAEREEVRAQLASLDERIAARTGRRRLPSRLVLPVTVAAMALGAGFYLTVRARPPAPPPPATGEHVVMMPPPNKRMPGIVVAMLQNGQHNGVPVRVTWEINQDGSVLRWLPEGGGRTLRANGKVDPSEVASIKAVADRVRSFEVGLASGDTADTIVDLLGSGEAQASEADVREVLKSVKSITSKVNLQ